MRYLDKLGNCGKAAPTGYNDRHIRPPELNATRPRARLAIIPPAMPTLSQVPLSRLTLLRRAPFPAQALALCALFAIAGVAILDDYGVAPDEIVQRSIAIANADYIATDDISDLTDDLNTNHRYYGLVIEMPLLLAERALGLQDSRHIYLLRHLLSHLLFIAGGFACAMLAYRMLGSKWVALFATLMFLLHPRLYAHSFFNTRDVPFAALMVIALYLAHRAFRKDTIGAFLLCGIGVGLAMNLRVFALMLPPMILAMRALDMRQADGSERKRILLTSAAFLAAALGTAYIIHPYYWDNPLWLIDGALGLSQNPNYAVNLFMGELYGSDALPWIYIPVWFAITAPPVALTLGALGAAAVCRRAITRPIALLRDRETRFRILLLGCIALPVAAAIILKTNIYNDWRHMYFLWAPFCLLAAVGLRCIANIRLRGGIRKIGARLPVWVRDDRRLHMAQRTLAYGVVAFGLITTATAMAALHPNQHVYFNALTHASAPGALAKRYDMDYWQMSHLQSLEYLLARYPDDKLRVRLGNPVHMAMLPQDDRERVMRARNLNSADYYISTTPYRNLPNTPAEPMIHGVEAYGSVISYAYAPKNMETHRAAYRDAAAIGTPLARADFDIYIHNGALHYISEDCIPLALKALNLRIFLQIVPVDLTEDSREHGSENHSLLIRKHAAFFDDGKCVITQPLPTYPIARIATGLMTRNGEPAWRTDIDLAAQALYAGITAGDYGQPVAQSDFDVYLRGASLAYLKEPCAPGDAAARFLLHIIPANPADLPADSREYGYENLNFQFADHGGRVGDICAAERELPAYPIDRIRAGQFVSGGGSIWSVEFAAGR